MANVEGNLYVSLDFVFESAIKQTLQGKGLDYVLESDGRALSRKWRLTFQGPAGEESVKAVLWGSRNSEGNWNMCLVTSQ